jgi:hypothetical protein
VGSLAARVAEVVLVLDLADDREEEAGDACERVADLHGQDDGPRNNEDDSHSSGRPVATALLRFAHEKCRTLASPLPGGVDNAYESP